MKRFLDWLLGPRCPECYVRVFVADREFHYRYDGCNGVWPDESGPL
jgi:hypothetical protein